MVDTDDAREQLDRVLEGTRSWLLTTHHMYADIGHMHAHAALEELTDPDLAHDAALSLLEICHPTLDYEHPPATPPRWWASPLGVAISRALARDDDLSLLRLMGSRASGVAGVVARARERGASWAQIGQALGISTQSAWERFAATSLRRPDPPPQPRP